MSHEPARRRMPRRAGAHRATVAAAITCGVVLAVAGCAGAPAIDTAPQPSASASPTPESGPVAQSTAPRAAGWLAGNHVTVDAAAYDPATGEVVLTTVVENTANTESFGADLAEYVLLDTGGGAPTPVSVISSVAVPSSSTSIDLTFQLAADAAVDLSRARLVLGGPGYATWSVPLGDDSEPEGTEPFDVIASGVADGGGLTFTATSAQVLPWACADVDDYGPAQSGRFWYEPGGEDEAALVIWGDISEAVSIVGGDTPLAASLTLPDGTAAAQIGTVYTVFDINEGIDDYPLCFTVPSPADGDYMLNWTTYRGASAQLAISVAD